MILNCIYFLIVDYYWVFFSLVNNVGLFLICTSRLLICSCIGDLVFSFVSFKEAGDNDKQVADVNANQVPNNEDNRIQDIRAVKKSEDDNLGILVIF